MSDPATRENDWRSREHARECRELWRAVYAASISAGHTSGAAFRNADDAVNIYSGKYV